MPQMRFKTFRTIFALSVREMSTSKGRAGVGYFWAVADPVLKIIVLAFIFELVLRSPDIGSNFHIFYASGILPYTFFTQTASKVARTINFSRSLLSYPVVTYIDAIAARFVVNAITNIMVYYVVVTGIIYFYDLRLTLNVPAILLAYTMASVLGLGIGTLNCFLFIYLPFWELAWSLMTRPLFILSGILYIYENVPSLLKEYLWYNPLIHVVGASRRGIYSTYDAAYVEPMYVFGIGLICLCIGLFTLNLCVREIVNR
ncbi:MAG: ABC transporter permease [Rhodobacteraceae bacterium]|nr:ABC transporter permease [Paracoccaceae bacterium]